MTNEEAVRKLEYSKTAYQMLIDEKVDSGKLVGKDVKGEWKADTPLDEAYKSMIDALEMEIKAIKALEQEPKILNTLDFAIDASNGDTNYFVGFRNGLRYSKSLIDGKEPQFESCTEQEPCGDAIDRVEAIKIASGYCHPSNVAKELANLPPVNPTKTGHWIEHPEIETSTPEYLMFYECSECGDKQCFCKSDIHKKRFCGNCGCRMEEPQERSDKDADKKCTYKETGCGSCKRQLDCPIEADTTESEDKA